MGMSYLIERGQKRARRLEAAKAATAVTRSQVTDNERGVAFQVGSLFINAQLAQSTLELAQTDVKSFQKTVDISEIQYKDGGMSENDYLKIKIQLVQFETGCRNRRQLGKAQALSDLRQQLGYESVPADYDVAGEFEYRPLAVSLDELQAKALQNRPDLRAAVLGVTAANSQYALAKANGKQDPTISGNYSHANGISGATWSFSIPLAIFDRNQGNIAQTRIAIRQAEEQQKAASGQVLTDVKRRLRRACRRARTSPSSTNPAISRWRRRAAISANTRTGAAPWRCSISWTPSEAIAPPNSPTARLWPLT